MPKNKREYEKALNEILGTDIQWSKLSLHELTQIVTLLNNPESLMKRLGVKTDRSLLRDRARKLMDTLELRGPFANLLRELLED